MNKNNNTFLGNISDFFKGLTVWPRLFVFSLIGKDFRNAFERLTWNRAMMERFEFNKLKEVVSYAYEHSEFYKKIYDDAGVSPDDLKRLEDIQKFPVVTKKILKQAIKEKTIFTSRKVPKGVAETSTTGSSGDPLTIYLDFNSRKQKYIHGMRAMWMMGALPNKRYVLIWRKKKKLISQRISAFFGKFKKMSVVDVMSSKKVAMDKEDMQKFLEEIVAFRPQIIHGYVSALWFIAKTAKKHNLHIQPEHVIAAAEYLPPAWQEEMEEVFQCPVHNLYGGTEASPIAASISGNRELTVFCDMYHAEVVGQKYEQLEAGKSGRIIITDYYNKYMPLIRYEIGDIAEWSKGYHGPFPAFTSVHGRINDIFVLPGGRVMFSHNWHIYFRDIQSVSKFKVTQKAIDQLEIILESEDLESNPEIEVVKNKIASIMGADVSIQWIILNKIELDPGEKFRSVCSKIDAETIINSI